MKLKTRLLLFMLLNGISSFAQVPQKPNIIIIMADDMGYSDLGSYGSEINTPNIDQLAKGGMRFTQFYNNARCCPSRASLMTGLYPHQAGIGQMDIDLKIPAYQGYLNKESVTLAEVLKNAGYNTYMSGKWHIGGQKGQWPTDRGFDHAFSMISGVSNYFGTKTFGSWYEALFTLDNERIYPGGKDYYLTDEINNRAVNYIKNNSNTGKPFFLYVAHAAPHWPLHALPEDIKRYEKVYEKGWDIIRKERYARMLKEKVISSSTPLSIRDNEIPAWENVPQKDRKDWTHLMAVYAAMVDRMDKGIGSILQTLKEQNQLDNTYIFFLADNGACSENRDLLDYVFKIKSREKIAGDSLSWQSYEKPWANVSNTPFRLYKSYLEQGGIATPFIAYHPKNIKAGSYSSQVSHIIDMMPTLTELAQTTYPATYQNNNILPFEGISLTKAFEGKNSSPKRSLFWEHEGNKAVRYKNWKLVKQYQKSWQLYNLEKDPIEAQNVAEKYPKLLAQLIKQYQQWEKRAQVLEWGPDMQKHWESRIDK